jgi:Holliday junction resolvasome RuvABC endonuclease subunit
LTKTIRVLGLDPGLSSTGYAVASIDLGRGAITRVLGIGVIQTSRDSHKTVRNTSDDLRRAKLQALALRKLVEQHDVRAIAAEMATTTPYTLPTFSFGVMIGILAALDVPVIELLPREVKRAVIGDDRATKKDMIAWALKKTARQKLPWPTSTRANKLGLLYQGKPLTLAAEHPADALAVIEAAIATEQFRLAHALVPSSLPTKLAR